MKKESNISKLEKSLAQLTGIVIELAKKIDSIEISIEKLAIMTSNGFDRVNQRLDRVESDVAELKIETKSLRSDMNDGFNKYDREILYVHENFIRKDELRALTLSAV